MPLAGFVAPALWLRQKKCEIGRTINPGGPPQYAIRHLLHG